MVLQRCFLHKKMKELQKQPSIAILRKRCSKNMQQIYRRTPRPKCDFNNIALQLTKVILQR